MSAAAIAAMAACIEEDRRRRQGSDYEALVSMYDVMEESWVGPVLLIISVVFCAAMFWMSLR